MSNPDLSMHIHGDHFTDSQGRRLYLRGINLGGSSKIPTRPDGATHQSYGFFDHRRVSFTGRPFPLDQARQHYERLSRWGFNFIRFLVTWEAIEHAGPGQYDFEYLDYITEVIRMAGDYGLQVYVDPHQDVWSRFSGGDGAPGWTFEAAGLDITAFKPTGAAIVHQTHGSPFPRMVWPTNAFKLAAATMFTLFFGGNRFAPSVKVEDMPIQEYLQDHYITSIARLAERLAGMAHVCGYGSMNEPLPGYIACADLHTPHALLRLGDTPTPLQTMALGAGIPQQVDNWELTITGPRRRGNSLVNANRTRAWLHGREDIWRSEGVWDVDSSGSPILLQPDYFCQCDGQPVDFSREHLLPFALRFAKVIRQAHPETLVFLETPSEFAPPQVPPQAAGWFVHAPHWYDAAVLMLKRFFPTLAFDVDAGRLVVGAKAIRKSHAAFLENLHRQAAIFPGGAPTLLGEFGIPFDLAGGKAYASGDFSAQAKAMDRSYTAVEDTLLDSALWVYTPDNTNAHGDLWNGEDLSIYSPDQQTDPEDIYSGGRALPASIRPHPRATAGQPVSLAFDLSRRAFTYTFIPDHAISAPTLVFIPRLHYPHGIQVRLEGGRWEYAPDDQMLSCWPQPGAPRCILNITPAPANPRQP